MKSLRLTALFILTLFAQSVFAQSKTDTIKVWGNCGMCKKRIETAANVSGVSSADWNVKSKLLTLSFDSTRVTLADSQKKIASAGHDTPGFTAADSIYIKLSRRTSTLKI
jgi:mercuric ion binding protein